MRDWVGRGEPAEGTRPLGGPLGPCGRRASAPGSDGYRLVAACRAVVGRLGIDVEPATRTRTRPAATRAVRSALPGSGRRMTDDSEYLGDKSGGDEVDSEYQVLLVSEVDGR